MFETVVLCRLLLPKKRDIFFCTSFSFTADTLVKLP